MAEKEFIVRVRGYLEGLEDLRKVSVGVGTGGTPILLGEVAHVQYGPDMRRGIAEWNGEGETVAGIVVVRYGANALQVIQKVKERLDLAMQRGASRLCRSSLVAAGEYEKSHDGRRRTGA